MRTLVIALGSILAACSQAESGAASIPKNAANETGVAAGPVEEEDTDNLVQLEVLLANEHELAIRYQIKPGWHLYWVNPGDSGLKTHATFEAPPGFSFAPLRYPTPEAFTSPGDLTSYGYQHETVLFSTFTMPDPPPEQSEVVVKASWLACKSSCIKGKGEAKIEIATAQAADDTLLIEHRQRLPRPGAELGATPTWTQAEEGPVLDVSVTAGKVEAFYPLQTDPARLDAQEVHPGGVKLRYKVGNDRLPEVSGPQGVIVLEQDDGRRSYFHVEIPWPEA